MDISDYQPIDYKTWILGNEARNGVNIKRLGVLRPKELELLEATKNFLDLRNDPGHTETSLYLGIQLLKFLPGVRDVVVPAITEHDTGWYGIDPEEYKRFVEANRGNLKVLDDEANRRPHQNRGIMIAGRIFQKLGYPDEKYHLEIADIIGDHDTRKLPTTDSGKIVRAADLLWRVTYPHAQIYLSKYTPQQMLQRIEDTCLEAEKYHLGEIGAKIGRLEFANMMHFKFGDSAKDVLFPKYKEELEKILSFYNGLSLN